MTRNELNAFINGIKNLRTVATDEQALDAIGVYPVWTPDKEYERLIRVRYGDKLYRCEQTHTSQSHYTPNMIPAIWTEVAKPGEILVWKQPTGAQDSYMTGDKVHYPNENGSIYVCTSDYNIYAPGVFGWELE